MAAITVLDQARKDLRRMGKGPERKRVLDGLRRLGGEDAALDIKAIRGTPGWFRLRVGNYRALYRVLTHDDGSREYLIRRVVHRRDLDAAAADLT